MLHVSLIQTIHRFAILAGGVSKCTQCQPGSWRLYKLHVVVILMAIVYTARTHDHSSMNERISGAIHMHIPGTIGLYDVAMQCLTPDAA